MNLRSIQVIGSLVTFLLSQHAGLAGEVGPSAFASGATVENFEELPVGAPILHATPLAIGPNVLSTDDGFLRWGSLFGAAIGRSGAGIATNQLGGFLDIQLNPPAHAAGLYVGAGFVPWTAKVSFFDQTNSLLGTLDRADSASGQFAGWESDVGSIARIRVQDTDINNFVVSIDDLSTLVPEPGSLTLTLLASIGAVLAFTNGVRLRRC
jgi:hypothetical protein